MMQGQNLLDQLRPNHLPDPIGAWPPAIGWWVLALLFVLILMGAGYWLMQWWQKNRYRSQGCQQVKRLYANYQQHQNARQFAHECNRLLKQVALHAYPQRDIASLHGQPWQNFLADTGRNPQFLNEEGQSLGAHRFTPDWIPPNADSLYLLTLSWIKKHHV